MGALQSVAFIFGAIIILSVLGIAGPAWDEFKLFLQEKEDSKNDSPSTQAIDDPNLAKDTGTRVCDLKLTNVGSIGDDLGNPLSNEKRLFFGDAGAINFGNQSPEIIIYEWDCTGNPITNSILYRLGKADAYTQSLFPTKSNGEVVRIYFYGISQNTGSYLYSPDASFKNKGSEDTPFSQRVVLKQDVEFPIQFSLTNNLPIVTEDDYTIFWWSDRYETVIGDTVYPVGKRHTYNLCAPDNFNENTNRCNN